MKDYAIWIGVAAILAIVLYAVFGSRGPSLRYIFAMVFAAVAALAATIYVASPVASYVTSRMRFESPDGAGDVHTYTFLGVSAAALVLGWIVGWLVASPLIVREQVR